MRILLLLLLLLWISNSCIAQRPRLAKVKDSLILSCPLNDASEVKAAYKIGDEDKKISIFSNTDTVVKASISGKVTTIRRDEEGKWEVVFYHDDYWLWYTGITKLAVKNNQVLKNGDTIGFIQPGEAIDFLVYDFETPLEPKKYLKCVIK